MIFSKIAISLIVALLLLSIFMSNLLNLIATDHNFYIEDRDGGINFTKYIGNKYNSVGSSPKNLIWFLQISDIHISIFRDPGRISQFQQFCDSTVKKVKPLVVLATGDLTDAKAKDNLGSSQVKTEWVYYYNIIKESGVTDDTVWLDIRGNHDNFNIKALNDQANYFRNYSVQGSLRPKSYVHIDESNGVKVAFMGIDACPEPGLRRPFNFIGVLDTREQQNIAKLYAEAKDKADHIVWFGHYPTSCIVMLDKEPEKMNLRKMIGESHSSQAYLCGHLHSMGGLVPFMYTKQKAGYLELELGDWKDNRLYRLVAIDHGHLSFIDQKHNVWPLVLVTNPKNARYLMPGREPLALSLASTHVRILAFSDVNIKTVEISFEKVHWMACYNVEGPLYVAQWTPSLYKEGLHNMYVRVVDELDKEAFIEHPFSLDGTIINFPVTPRILLMLDAGVVFQAVFSTLLILNVVPLVIMRITKQPPQPGRSFHQRMIRRMWLLSKVDRIFYPIVLYALYLPFGPWSIGELIDGHIGVIFAWGILIKGSFLPEPFTYIYGGVQLMFVQIPLILVLAQTLDYYLAEQYTRGYKRVVKHFPFILLLSVQLLLAYFFWLEYGTLSFIIGPLRTWSVPLSILLWYKTMTLPPDVCRKLLRLYEPTSQAPL
ncbi:hypothetical protein JYU34_008475 [Plutella xylostella]|uniref:Calcineurin-like phosphoesterase domain-containing protein n=1 Tax=Plutella xylostella TaxID=51655 RepID=A0ABQ7QL53_PLUXY|nr:hypothetical protein JYU34_008475 [Plutella xylostella]